MADYPQSYCIYHPAELITNFCCQKNCLLPLCPSCVCTHIDYHLKNGDRPRFDNIYEALDNVGAALNQCNSRMQDNKRRLELVQRDANWIISKVCETLFQAKTQVHDIIDKRFEEIEADTLQYLQKQSMQTGLYDSEKLNILSKRIQAEIEEIQNTLTDLKSERALSSLIIFRSEKGMVLDSTHQEISKYLELNEHFKPDVSINEEVFEMISQNISKILQIKINMPPEVLLPSRQKQMLPPHPVSPRTPNLQQTPSRIEQRAQPRVEQRVEPMPPLPLPNHTQSANQHVHSQYLQNNQVGQLTSPRPVSPPPHHLTDSNKPMQYMMSKPMESAPPMQRNIFQSIQNNQNKPSTLAFVRMMSPQESNDPYNRNIQYQGEVAKQLQNSNANTKPMVMARTNQSAVNYTPRLQRPESPSSQSTRTQNRDSEKKVGLKMSLHRSPSKPSSSQIKQKIIPNAFLSTK